MAYSTIFCSVRIVPASQRAITGRKSERRDRPISRFPVQPMVEYAGLTAGASAEAKNVQRAANLRYMQIPRL